MLSDLLRWAQNHPRLFVWFLKVMGYHTGLHIYCPGWCPCGEDDDLEKELQWQLVTG